MFTLTERQDHLASRSLLRSARCLPTNSISTHLSRGRHLIIIIDEERTPLVRQDDDRPLFERLLL